MSLYLNRLAYSHPKFAYKSFLLCSGLGASSWLFIDFNALSACLTGIQWLLCYVYARKRYRAQNLIAYLEWTTSSLGLAYKPVGSKLLFYRAELKEFYFLSDFGIALVLYVPHIARFESLFISSKSISKEVYSDLSFSLASISR